VHGGAHTAVGWLGINGTFSTISLYAVAPTPWGTEDTCPHFYKWLGTGGGTVSRRTANKKLTKLY